jgi:hypothetical protein
MMKCEGNWKRCYPLSIPNELTMTSLKSGGQRGRLSSQKSNPGPVDQDSQYAAMFDRVKSVSSNLDFRMSRISLQRTRVQWLQFREGDNDRNWHNISAAFVQMDTVTALPPQLTPWSRVLLETLILTQLVKKFFNHNGAWWLTAMFTRSLYLVP